MTNKVHISVLVCAHNEELYLGRCIRSLLSQNFPREGFEIIVVDDGSTDRTAYALSQFVSPLDQKIRAIYSQTNIGLPACLNLAIAESSGEYLVRVDADDFVNTNFLNFLYTYLQMNDHVDAVACDYLFVDEDETILRRANCDDEPIACGILFRRDHVQEAGYYDQHFKLNEEKEFRIRFEKKFSIGRLDIPLYRYRRHPFNMTNDIEAMKRYESLIQQKHGQKNDRK